MIFIGKAPTIELLKFLFFVFFLLILCFDLYCLLWYGLCCDGLYSIDALSYFHSDPFSVPCHYSELWLWFRLGSLIYLCSDVHSDPSSGHYSKIWLWFQLWPRWFDVCSYLFFLVWSDVCYEFHIPPMVSATLVIFGLCLQHFLLYFLLVSLLLWYNARCITNS